MQFKADKENDVSGTQDRPANIGFRSPTQKCVNSTKSLMKTNKSYTKRIKVTKNGKLVARRPGQNHFNARQSGQQRLRRKRTQNLVLSKRITRRFLPRTGA